MLRIDGLKKSYPTPLGPQIVLDGVSLSLERGESLALMGESGSGKSTLLHLIAGLDAPDAGVVRLDGVDLAQLTDAGRAALRRDRIGLVFQQFNLIPSLAVADNIAFQARLAGRDDPAWRATLTERLGLAGLEDRFPEQLSGGQQQRVALGRTLAARPDLLLADEPTGNLDAATGEAVMRLTLALARDADCAFLMATHSGALAATLSRRTMLVDGRLAEDASIGSVA